MDKLIDLLIKAWEKAGSPLWDSILFWRTAALILMSGATAVWFFRRRLVRHFTHEKFLAHDNTKFAAANEILPEQFANDVLSWIRENARVADDDVDAFRKFCLFFSLEENQFLIPELREAASHLTRKISKLSEFMIYHFFPVPESGQYQLYPELKHSSDPQKIAIYARRLDELADHVDSVIPAYKDYRRAVKKTLLR